MKARHRLRFLRELAGAKAFVRGEALLDSIASLAFGARAGLAGSSLPSTRSIGSTIPTAIAACCSVARTISISPRTTKSGLNRYGGVS